MRDLILSMVVVGALLGLAVVQYSFLRVAIQLEKVRFDQEARLVLQSVSRRMADSPPLKQQLQRLQEAAGMPPREEIKYLEKAVADSITWLIDGALQEEGLSLDYSFAIKGGLLLYPVVSKNGFTDAREDSYRTYRLLLQGPFREKYGGELVFYLQIKNLFPLLIKRLYGLLLPAAAFLLLLLAALLFMIRALLHLRELDRVKNDFINNLTHELKTPAFSISLLLKLLRQSIGAGDRRRSGEYLNLLYKENEQLKGHIHKVLELASMETGRYELQFAEQQLHPLLEEIIQQYQHKAATRGGKLVYMPDTACGRLMADERYLRSAIQNLLDNALLYGGAPPHVSVLAQSQEGRILISVTDNGPGIALKEQRLLFRKFYRIPHGDVHKAKGFGLGLSFTQEIARAHGGKVRVESTVGEGSTFTLDLPALG